MTRLLLFASVLLVVGASASALILRAPTRLQEVAPACCALAPPSSNATVFPSDVIDGAKNPSLIPDAIAYRLVLLNVAAPADATTQEKARQRAFLKDAGLRDEDIEPASRTLEVFKFQYDGFVSQYNESVRVANATGEQPDLASFLSQLNDLVRSTTKALEARMPPQVASRFEAHVQREKRNMRIAKEAK